MHKPVKHLVVAAASIVVAVGSPAAQTIDMVVDSAIYTIELNASAAAENFAKRLPMKVVWEDFGKLERIARLSERLDVGRDPVVKSPVRGTFAYYVPWGNLCLFRIGGNAPSRDLVELGAWMRQRFRRSSKAAGAKWSSAPAESSSPKN